MINICMLPDKQLDDWQTHTRWTPK